MKKTTLIIIVSSIGLTCGVSALFGFAGSAIIGSFWGWFSVTLLFQFILFGIVNSYLVQRDTQVFQQQEIDMLDKLSKFTIKLTCSYCQQSNLVPIQLNQRNSFKCEGCNQVNGVSMQFMATSLTTPVEAVKIPTQDSSAAEFRVVQ